MRCHVLEALIETMSVGLVFIPGRECEKGGEPFMFPVLRRSVVTDHLISSASVTSPAFLIFN